MILIYNSSFWYLKRDVSVNTDSFEIYPTINKTYRKRIIFWKDIKIEITKIRWNFEAGKISIIPINLEEKCVKKMDRKRKGRQKRNLFVREKESVHAQVGAWEWVSTSVSTRVYVIIGTRRVNDALGDGYERLARRNVKICAPLYAQPFHRDHLVWNDKQGSFRAPLSQKESFEEFDCFRFGQIARE